MILNLANNEKNLALGANSLENDLELDLNYI